MEFQNEQIRPGKEEQEDLRTYTGGTIQKEVTSVNVSVFRIFFKKFC